MPTISAMIISHPRTSRYCDGVIHEKKLMPAGKPQMRLYGNGCTGDPKHTLYTLYICLECASNSDNDKIVNALKTFNQVSLSDPATCKQQP